MGPKPGILAMRKPILITIALAAAFTACWGSLERSDRMDARDRAADRVASYAPGTNLRAESRPAAAVGLAVAARERAPSDFPPIRPADVTPAMILRTGQANIEVDSLEPAVALVRQLARQLGGYVANTALQTGRGQLRSATIEVKVPANRFDEGLGGLAPIGKLESVNVSAEDVGEEFTDATARMANARRLETRLIELIATRTGKLKDVLDVEQELARGREEIDRYEGRLSCGLAAALAAVAPAARAQGGTRSRQTEIVTAAARLAPAVVSVNVLRRERRVAADPFDLFFMPRGYEQTVEGYGSGFIVSPDGLVITNQHVTQGAEQIVVTARDGRDFPAKILGEDPLTDIAVLKIDGGSLPVAPLGKSTDLQIGEWLVAAGNPFAYLLGNTEPTVTAGVVSAVGRNLLPSEGQSGVYVGMIQTDAAINPGNSGGPLANALGEVVGVNSNILTPSGGSVGVGFAIPIERAVRVADELRRFGTVRRAWVGLDVAGAEDLRGWERVGGLRVTLVAENGPAARAGIAEGDVLLVARGHRLRTFLDWEAVLLDTGPGDTLTV